MQNTKMFLKAVKYKIRSMIEQKSVPINWHKSFILYPFKLFFHPIDTFNDLKYEGKASMIIANFLAALFFVVKLLQQINEEKFLKYLYILIKEMTTNQNNSNMK